MTKFTKTEIDLCKQVAEKHGKSLVKGDWYWSEEWKSQEMVIAGMTIKNQKLMSCFKLWTISDCLEFLKEKSGESPSSLDIDTTISKVLLGIASVNDLNIACLKAVLAMLEEEFK